MNTEIAQPEVGSQFVERLRYCVSKMKSARALAEKAGIPASTLHTYLNGVEPQRPALISLAEAANVDIAWLVSGEAHAAAHSGRHAPSTSTGDGADPARKLSEIQGASGIRERVKGLLSGLEEEIKARTQHSDLPPERFDALVRAKSDITGAEIALLHSVTDVNPRWLLFSDGPISQGKLGSPHFRAWHPLTNPEDRRNFYDAVANLSGPLFARPFKTHVVVGNAMSPKYNPGNVIIVDPSASLAQERAGTFVFRHSGAEFLAYASSDGRQVKLSFEQPKIEPVVLNFDAFEGTHETVGRVIYYLSLATPN